MLGNLGSVVATHHPDAMASDGSNLFVLIDGQILRLPTNGGTSYTNVLFSDVAKRLLLLGQGSVFFSLAVGVFQVP